jgi:hypothetical protein
VPVLTDKANYMTPGNPNKIMHKTGMPNDGGFRANRVDEIFKFEALKRSVRSAGKSMNPRLRSN